MKTQLPVRAGLIAVIAVSIVPSPARGDSPKKANTDPLASTAPLLDHAAADLAAGRLDRARERFQDLAADPSQSPWIRGLAHLGLAETAIAADDTTTAIATLQELSDDTTLLRAHRDLARCRAAALKRLQQGLAPYDPAIHRVALPAVREAAATFHVAPDGRGTADGSAARPFPSLQAARDAVRAWKRRHAASIPEACALYGERTGT